MGSCDCGELTAQPIERVDQAPTGVALDAIVARSERVAFERFRWRSVYRCGDCGQLWGEHAWSSGMMDVFYLFPIETDDPARWAKESDEELAPPVRGSSAGRKKRAKRTTRRDAPARNSRPDTTPPLGTTEENVLRDPDDRNSGYERVPILAPVAELERPPSAVRPDGTALGATGPVRRVIFAPDGRRFAFVLGAAIVAVADETLDRVLAIASFHENAQPVRSLGFDASGEALAVGTGDAYEVRDFGPMRSGCGFSVRRVSDGAVLEEHATEEPVVELPPAFAHGDAAPLQANEHPGAGGFAVRWGAKNGDILSTVRDGRVVAELVVETWAEAPPRVDAEGRRVWTFAHGRTTVFDVASGGVLFHGREPPAELRPPGRDERRELRILDRETKVAAMGAQTTVRAQRHALAIYRGSERRPFAWARVFTQVLALTEDERFLVAGGPRRYLVFDLAR